MAFGISLPVVNNGWNTTDRRDAWWQEPLWMGVALTAALLYTAVRVLFFGESITLDGHRVTSPLFSPNVIHIFDLSTASWVNSAMLLLWLPFGFRGTCYYTRRVYFRTFFAQPSGCAVGAKNMAYLGERRGIFWLNNIHRYMLILVVFILLWKYYDVFHSLHSTDGWGMSVGSIVLATEAFLLTMYVTSCHAFRHMVGGNLDRFFEKTGTGDVVRSIRKAVWSFSSRHNPHHGMWFWLSLAMVFLGDAYVWSLAANGWTDPGIWF